MEKVLRKDVLCVTVIQNDEGIGQELHLIFRNVVMISSGGYGYAKIPLLLRPLDPLPSPRKDVHLLSLTGSLQTHPVRKKCPPSENSFKIKEDFMKGVIGCKSQRIADLLFAPEVLVGALSS